MTVFIVLAAALCLALFGYALWPVVKQQRMAGAGIGTLSIALVGLLYWQLGKPEAIGYVAPQPEQTIETALADLEDVVKQQPDNLEATLLLARSYLQLGQYPQAQRHFKSATLLQPDNAQIMVDYAEALFRAGRPDQPDAQARQWIDKALVLDPENQRARFFLGILLLQSGKPAEAADVWQRLLPQLDAATAKALLPQINQARSLSGQPELVLPEMKSISVRITLAPALRAEDAPGKVLFVFARQTDGAGPPIAAKRVENPQWPLTLTLSDADSIMPTRKLSDLPVYTLTARLSASGSADAGANDWQSPPVRVQSDTLSEVTLTLSPKP